MSCAEENRRGILWRACGYSTVIRHLGNHDAVIAVPGGLGCVNSFFLSLAACCSPRPGAETLPSAATGSTPCDRLRLASEALVAPPRCAGKYHGRA
jgi:hypothetical protein